MDNENDDDPLLDDDIESFEELQNFGYEYFLTDMDNKSSIEYLKNSLTKLNETNSQVYTSLICLLSKEKQELLNSVLVNFDNLKK